MSSALSNLVAKATPYVSAAKNWVTANPNAVAQTADLLYGMYRDRKTWRREDTAYRRATRDMDLAGLNTFNSGSVSAAGSSPSSAMSNFMALKQMSQRDRELDIQEKVAQAQIDSANYGILGKYAGNKIAGLIDKGASTALDTFIDGRKKHDETRKKKEAAGLDPFLPHKDYPTTYFQGVLDWIARRGMQADFPW